MRLDGQLPDQLMRIADAGFHTPETGLRQIFVIISAAAPIRAPAAVKATPGTTMKSMSAGSHGRSAPTARRFRKRPGTALRAHSRKTASHRPPTRGHDKRFAALHRRQRRTGLRLVGQRAEKRRASGPAKIRADAPPGRRYAPTPRHALRKRARGSVFSSQRAVLS